MTDSQREWIDERAAIIEYEAGEDRATAEDAAARLWAPWMDQWDAYVRQMAGEK